jgi:hypothetical protein
MKKLRRRSNRIAWRSARRSFACSATELLAVQWRSLSPQDLALYFKRLITRECQCRPRAINPVVPPLHAYLHPRYRRRRMEVVKKLTQFGVTVSSRASAWSLPSWREWPGSMYLIGTNCDADLKSPRRPRFAFIGGRSVRQQSALEAMSRAA